MTRNRQIAIGIGILISAVFLFLAFQGLQPDQFLASLQGVDIGLLFVAAVLYFGAVILISLRWQYLLRSIQAVPLTSLVQLVSIGYMGNNVYPLRAGEALRIFLTWRNHRVPVAKTATTVIIERVFDGLVMLSFLMLALLVVDIQSDEIHQVINLAAPVFLVAIIAFFVLASQPDLLRRIEKFVVRFLPPAIGQRIDNLAEDIIHGLESLRSPLYLAGAVITSFISWGIEAAVYWVVMFAFGLDLGYPVALLVVGTVNLSGILPATSGQFGVYEFFVKLALVAIGVGEDIALAYAIVVHIVIWLPVTLVGFAFLIRQGLGWTDITQAQKLESTADAAVST